MLDEKIQADLDKKDRSLTATGIMIFVIIVLLVLSYYKINQVLRDRSLRRMEEGVNTVTEEITSKFERDSRILNATADIISQANNLDIEETKDIMEKVMPLLETMRVRVLLPGDQVIIPDGSVTDATDNDSLSFETESLLGEHVSDRIISSSGVPMLRHFIPIKQNGKTVAVLYGVTILEDLRKSLNIDNIYNASADVFIIDTKTGDYILDTRHEQLGNMNDFEGESQGHETKGHKSWEEYLNDVKTGVTDYVIYRSKTTGNWEYMYYSPSGINEWVITVSVPEKEAFASVFTLQRICTYLSVLLSVAIVIYYLWVRRNAKNITRSMVERAVLAEKLQKAEAADRAKSTFLSNMSHDIRTPMNAILGFATLAQTNIDNKEKTQEYLGKILSSGNHLLSLINDILDMSRIESGKLNIEEKECSISDIFRDMRNIIQTQMQSKNLNFFMDTIDVIDENIYCDKLHVNQVLLNLLSNAIKFTPAGGTVALTIKQKERAPKGYGSYEIRVKDTGIGMSEDFKKHIFEPFERERNSTASGIQGTGLGMAITKNIVDTMGGTIELESEQGKGTEFIINIDFKLQEENQHVEVIEQLQGMRALVVDDSFTTCDSVTKMLRQIGMRSDWVLHGKEAVLHAKQAYELGDEYHVYIVDWLLPDLNGIEVVRQIRAIVGEDTPIIIVTAYDWTDFEEEARKAGATAFCNKPIFLSDLRDILVAATSDGTVDYDNRNVPDSDTVFQGTHILLAEDNELNREIAVELLSESGFIVDTAEDGTAAVEKVKNSKPGDYALVLMDIQMPKMDGYEATMQIRQLDNAELAGIPIIAMTANAFEEDKKKALESGMNAHIAKPIDVTKLLEVLAYILKKN